MCVVLFCHSPLAIPSLRRANKNISATDCDDEVDRDINTYESTRSFIDLFILAE
jgi:hypothetical protein